jgi:hypothetical protein
MLYVDNENYYYWLLVVYCRREGAPEAISGLWARPLLLAFVSCFI